MNNTSVDAFLADGCGRCEHYRTPQCKVHPWNGVLTELRELLLASGLTEEMKWGAPCYTLNGKNVVMLAALREYCALSFFKGALLSDKTGDLELPGPNSHAGRLLRFTTSALTRTRRHLAARYIDEAIRVERSGATVAPRKAPEPTPAELQARLDADPPLRAAFEALTPGRRRSYILHVSRAKQSKTRAARAERCVPKILAGKGFNER